VSDNSVSNNFDYKEYINAAYLIFASKIKDFGYQVGLRAEATNTKGTLFTTGQTFDKKYVDFFPSVSLTQKLGMQNEFQLSYSRRINRPNLRMINPFIDYSDPLNLKQGNPDINPEYIDSYELSYLRYLGSTIITSSVFYRQTHGLITRYRTLLDSITTFTTIENLSSAKSYGIELIGNSQITPWWNLSGNFSYYRTDINASNLQADLTNSGYAWTAKFITNFKLPLGLNLSVSYYYLSKRPTALGEIQPLQAMDISLKKEFLGGRASLSARGSDIFNTQQFNMNIANSGFTEYATRKRDSRNAYLTFTYNFGNMYDKNQKQKKGKRPDDNNNSPDEEDY
jgi:outer membrane receptor protein involved in Fe transport